MKKLIFRLVMQAGWCIIKKERQPKQNKFPRISPNAGPLGISGDFSLRPARRCEFILAPCRILYENTSASVLFPYEGIFSELGEDLVG